MKPLMVITTAAFFGICCKRLGAVLLGEANAREPAGFVPRRHFEDEMIVLCVRWYVRYSLSYRDLEEMMADRGLAVDHSTVWRWVQRYAPILHLRMRRGDFGILNWLSSAVYFGPPHN
jgi:hypothetical protein